MKNTTSLLALSALVTSFGSYSQEQWISHILDYPISDEIVIPNFSDYGRWMFTVDTEIYYRDNDWMGNEIDSVYVDFKPRLLGYYEINDQLRVTADLWMKYSSTTETFRPTGDVTSSSSGYSGNWDHAVIGLEHETFGGISYGAHTTTMAITVMDRHNQLGLVDQQTNPKQGNKFFYTNTFGSENDLYVRAMYKPNSGEEEDEWGTTLGLQNMIAYASNAVPFATYGIYLDVTNEQYMSQSADFGGGNLHNTNNEPVYSLASYYGNGKGTYVAGHIAYSDNNGIDYEDQPIGFNGNNPNGQGVSAGLLLQHSFSNGLIPTVSVGYAEDGNWAILDLGYQINRNVELFAIAKLSSDDETQNAVGVKFSM